MKRIIKWSQHKFNFNQRFFITILVVVFFLVLIPMILIIRLPELDKIFKFPSFSFGILNFILGGILVLIGVFYSIWSIISQLTQAQRTPLPVMATQKLLVNGPFKQSRNPMGFGLTVLYFGVGIIVSAFSTIIVVLFFFLALIFYIKVVEEKELELRFGKDYVEYKNSTPFIIPNLWKK